MVAKSEYCVPDTDQEWLNAGGQQPCCTTITYGFTNRHIVQILSMSTLIATYKTDQLQ